MNEETPVTTVPPPVVTAAAAATHDDDDDDDNAASDVEMEGMDLDGDDEEEEDDDDDKEAATTTTSPVNYPPAAVAVPTSPTKAPKSVAQVARETKLHELEALELEAARHERMELLSAAGGGGAAAGGNAASKLEYLLGQSEVFAHFMAGTWIVSWLSVSLRPSADFSRNSHPPRTLFVYGYSCD
jgi:SWI/SNF-related matrix-associated actin-dependent regulator of chromatin subfamily A member 5